jgi:hypothetical protein
VLPCTRAYLRGHNSNMPVRYLACHTRRHEPAYGQRVNEEAEGGAEKKNTPHKDIIHQVEEGSPAPAKAPIRPRQKQRGGRKVRLPHLIHKATSDTLCCSRPILVGRHTTSHSASLP